MAAALARLKRFGPEIAGLAALALVLLLQFINPGPLESSLPVAI